MNPFNLMGALCCCVPSATAENDMTHLEPVSRVGPAVANTAESPHRSHLKQYGPVISVKSHTQEGVFPKSIGFISHMHLLKSLRRHFAHRIILQGDRPNSYLLFSLFVLIVVCVFIDLFTDVA